MERILADRLFTLTALMQPPFRHSQLVRATVEKATYRNKARICQALSKASKISHSSTAARVLVSSRPTLLESHSHSADFHKDATQCPNSVQHVGLHRKAPQPFVGKMCKAMTLCRRDTRQHSHSLSQSMRQKIKSLRRLQTHEFE